MPSRSASRRTVEFPRLKAVSDWSLAWWHTCRDRWRYCARNDPRSRAPWSTLCVSSEFRDALVSLAPPTVSESLRCIRCQFESGRTKTWNVKTVHFFERVRSCHYGEVWHFFLVQSASCYRVRVPISIADLLKRSDQGRLSDQNGRRFRT
jgi:hypothetical protein